VASGSLSEGVSLSLRGRLSLSQRASLSLSEGVSLSLRGRLSVSQRASLSLSLRGRLSLSQRASLSLSEGVSLSLRGRLSLSQRASLSLTQGVSLSLRGRLSLSLRGRLSLTRGSPPTLTSVGRSEASMEMGVYISLAWATQRRPTLPLRPSGRSTLPLTSLRCTADVSTPAPWTRVDAEVWAGGGSLVRAREEKGCATCTWSGIGGEGRDGRTCRCARGAGWRRGTRRTHVQVFTWRGNGGESGRGTGGRGSGRRAPSGRACEPCAWCAPPRQQLSTTPQQRLFAMQQQRLLAAAALGDAAAAAQPLSSPLEQLPQLQQHVLALTHLAMAAAQHVLCLVFQVCAASPALSRAQGKGSSASGSTFLLNRSQGRPRLEQHACVMRRVRRHESSAARGACDDTSRALPAARAATRVERCPRRVRRHGSSAARGACDDTGRALPAARAATRTRNTLGATAARLPSGRP
jgi:hypothetical protein